MSAQSPSSSPRLPSPPPIAEDQIGPMSPGVSLFEDHGKLPGGGNLDTGAARRIRPGTRSADMAEGPPLVELQEIDSAFQLTEHLKALYYHHTHPPESNEVRAITKELAQQLAEPPTNTTGAIWLYELGRFLVQKSNAFIVALFADSPPCSLQTCPEMRASEWQYLCAVHDPPKSCSAIDYCCHTLDWAAGSLTSSKMFPSRLGLGSGGAGGTDKFLNQQMKEITNIFRRVYRIYAHAWFQHRDMFWKIEGRTGLYIFFKTVCDRYNLIQPENYTIPAEAEGLEPAESTEQQETEARPRPTSILPRPGELGEEKGFEQEPAGNTQLSSGGTTKYHARQPSDMSVTNPIQEEAEEEDDQGDAKPNPDRSSTILHDSEHKPHEKVVEVKDELHAAESEFPEEPQPQSSLSRSDTVKPEKQAVKEVEREREEEEAAADSTVILHDSTEATKPRSDEPEIKVEAVEPAESPAASEEEAGKSVED
ncbi:MOB-like protein phocein [Fulvia fulva]|nr:MOB-like protein phocein [Fulvia fulva]WPV12384.1 MOB-like protein phocein [Fulvia fulva]WPV27296.1 MOB-like protein phocein [Fulvia fulva]